MNSRCTDYGKLSDHVFQAFWNEYLFKANCYRRRYIPLTKSNAWFSIAAFGPENSMRHRLRSIRWLVATLCNCLWLSLARPVQTGPFISLTTHVRYIRFLPPESQVFRIGLHCFRLFRYPHILSVLTFRERLRGFGLAFTCRRQFTNACRRECDRHNVDFKVFCRLCNIGYFRFADYVLNYMALTKVSPVKVAISFQMEAYSSILSTYRDAELRISLVGYQHGLFELPPPPHRYAKVRFDEYVLLYRESEHWFVSDFSGNPDCVIKFREHPSTIRWQEIDRTGFAKVVAYAAQDYLPVDHEIMDALLAYVDATNSLLLLYLHPNFHDFLLPHRPGARNLRVCPRERHKNIDLLVTRYSTLAMDYRSSLGVDVLFVPGHDNICIFDNRDVKTCRDLGQLGAILSELLTNPCETLLQADRNKTR